MGVTGPTLFSLTPKPDLASYVTDPRPSEIPCWPLLLNVPIRGLIMPKPELSTFPAHSCVSLASVNGIAIYLVT